MDEDAIAQALQSVAKAIHYLGNGDAGTTMGGLEYVGASIREGMSEVASAVSDLADAVRHMEK